MPELDLTGDRPADDERKPPPPPTGEQAAAAHAAKDRADADEEKRPRGRPSNTARRRTLEDKLKGGLNELADTIARRDPELGEVLRQDGPKMASLIAGAAVRIGGPVLAAAVLFATVLEPLRAFGRTGRLVLDRAAARRRAAAEARAAAEPPPDEPPAPDAPPAG